MIAATLSSSENISRPPEILIDTMVNPISLAPLNWQRQRLSPSLDERVMFPASRCRRRRTKPKAMDQSHQRQVIEGITETHIKAQGRARQRYGHGWKTVAQKLRRNTEMDHDNERNGSSSR